MTCRQKISRGISARGIPFFSFFFLGVGVLVHGHGFAGVEILRTLGHGGAMRSWNVDALEDPGVVCGIETRRRRQSVRGTLFRD